MEGVTREVFRQRAAIGRYAKQEYEHCNEQVLKNQIKPLPPNKDKKVLNQVTPIKTIPTNRIVKLAAILFVASCLVPPWQFTFDKSGDHSRNPAGYSFLIFPPSNPAAIGKPANSNRYGFPDSLSSPWEYYPPPVINPSYGVQIDFGRLFLEWSALAAVAGMFWALVIKPAPQRDNKAIHPEKSNA